MPSNFLLKTAAIALALTISSSVWAQQASSAPGSDPARIEQRIAKLHEQLQISSAEESVWNNVASVMRENAHSMYQSYEQRHAHIDSLDATKNLHSYASSAELHARNMQRFAAAFEKLYQVMPAEQKKIADQVFRARANRF